MSIFAAMSSGSVDIRAQPDVALVDDVVHIKVKGLGSFQQVTIAAILDEDDKIFVSHAFYISDATGRVDCNSMPSLGGTFYGVEPMGLLWSMKQGAGQIPGLRLIKQNVETPFLVNLYLYNGYQHIIGKEDIAKHEKLLLAQTTLKRYYQSPEVLAFPIRAGSIRGVLYLPPGDGPFPGIIDMFGGVGGLVKCRAALLASRGFAALALAYFSYEDLPLGVDLQMEYFEEAAEWLCRHPLVLKNGIGVVGVSKGGALALDMATKCPKVKAVVSINGPAIHNTGIHHYKGEPQFVLNPIGNEDFFTQTEEGIRFGESFAVNENNKQHVIPVETAESAHFLLIYSGDDPTTPVSNFQAIIERLKVRGKTNYELLFYPKAGHLIEPPYTQLCRFCYAKLVGGLVVYGGETRAHSVAQEHSWRRLLSFLREYLTAPGDDRRQYTSSKL